MNFYQEILIHKWLISQRIPPIFNTSLWLHSHMTGLQSAKENSCIWQVLLGLEVRHTCSRALASWNLSCFGFQLLKCHFRYFNFCIFSFFKVKQSEKQLYPSPRRTKGKTTPRYTAADPLFATAYYLVPWFQAFLHCNALTPKWCMPLSMSLSFWLQFTPLPNKIDISSPDKYYEDTQLPACWLKT